MRFAWTVVAALAAGCASIAGTVPGTRQYDAPMSRVKPAFVSTLSGMGMMITSVEARGGHEVLKARKGSSEVKIELEPVGRSATRARVGAKTGGLLYDDDAAARIMRLAERHLAGT